VLIASAHRIRGLGLLVVAVSLFAWGGVASARQSSTPKTVRYRGYAVNVPRSWKVFDLSKHPQECVRFNRHAVYLGRPGSRQMCPAHAIGRTEAILLAPASATVRRALAHPAAGGASAHVPQVEGAATTFVAPKARVLVTATWSRHVAVVAHALHRGSLRPRGLAHAHAAQATPSVVPERAAKTPALARTAAASFKGLGFDTCAAPSSSAMAAWQSSPYEAVGIYIGGANNACAQANLTRSWVAGQVAAGWHMVPIYVGLQAPSNACRCAGISPARAASQGTAAAVDAVADADAIGIPAGNPIYNDMEAYTVTRTNTAAVLAFLSAWTTELHAEGYVSGVYSSTGSGIADLVAKLGTRFVEPDDIWFAEWNGEKTVATSALPASDFVNHRLHQYRGGHNETYGRVTLNIDNNLLRGDTADTSGTLTSTAPPLAPSPPTLRVAPAPDGTTALTVRWTTATGLASWRVLTGTSPDAPTALTRLTSARAHGASRRISVRSAAPAFAVQALGSTGQVLATTATVATPAHVAVFGHSAFVPSRTGTGGVPVGCYTGVVCDLTTTVFAGRTVIAKTGTEHIAANGTGLVFFKLTSKGRKLLSTAVGPRLKVHVKVLDTSGAQALVPMTLIPFATTGRGPRRSITQAPPLQLVGSSDFVSARGVGGILAGCASITPCPVRTVITAGHTVLARTKRGVIGANELGYLIFSLTSRGRDLLAHARSNQLGAQVTISSGIATARANIALVGFR
jgi:hypothetical protein